MKKRIISLLLCLCMVFSLLPMSVFAEDVAEDVAQTLDVPAAQTVGDVSKQSNNDKRSTYATMSWTWTVTAIGGNYYAKNGSPSSANKYTVNRSLDNSVDHQVGYKFVWDASAGSTAYDGGWQLCMTVDGSVVESTTCYIFDRDMSNVSDTKTAPKSSHTGNSSLPFTLYLSNYPMKKYTYRLTYELNDGSDRYMNKEAVNGVTNTICTFTVTTQEPTRDGYKFLGWADSASATEAQYHAGHKITLYSSNPEKVIYAVWEKKQESKVTYHLIHEFNYDGGTRWDIMATTAQSPYKMDVNKGIPTRKGYKFLGWADDADATAAQYHGGDLIELDKNNTSKTIYAVWTPHEHDFGNWTPDPNDKNKHIGTCTDPDCDATTSEDHVDADSNGICDKCNKCLHDHDDEGYCTVAGCDHTEKGYNCCPKKEDPKPEVKPTPPTVEQLLGGFVIKCVSSGKHNLDAGSLGLSVALKSVSEAGTYEVVSTEATKGTDGRYYVEVKVNNVDAYLPQYEQAVGSIEHERNDGVSNELTLTYYYNEETKAWAQDTEPVVDVKCEPEPTTVNVYVGLVDSTGATLNTADFRSNDFGEEIVENRYHVGALTTTQTLSDLTADPNGDGLEENNPVKTFIYQQMAKYNPAPGYETNWTPAEGVAAYFEWARQIRFTELKKQDDGTYNLYGQIIAYKLSLDLDGGTLTEDTVSGYYLSGSEVTLPQPTKSGYKFLGWTKKEEPAPNPDGGAIYLAAMTAIDQPQEIEVSYDVTYIANWEKLPEPNVHFVFHLSSKLGDGEQIASVKYSGSKQIGETLDLTSAEFNPHVLLESIGKDFNFEVDAGWYNDGEFNEYRYNNNKKDARTELEITGAWQNLHIVVTELVPVVYFSSAEALKAYQNDHSKTEGILGSTTARVGSTLPTADAPTATREGYTFKFWSREGQTGNVSGQPVNGWTNLYANWERTYSIYYDGNGGTFTKGGKDFTHVSDNDLTLGKPHTLRENVFTREHYEFTGWAKTKEGPKDYDGGATDVTFAESDLNGKGQVRLYAQWKPVEVDVNVYITPVDSGEEDSLLVNDVKLNAATLARIGLKAYETDEDGEAIDRILVGKYASKIAAGLTEDLFGDDITTDVTNELSGFQAAAGLPATFTTNNILGNTTWTCLSVEGEENFLSGNLPLCFVRFATEDEANVTGMPTQEYSYNGAPIYDYYLKGEKVAAPAEDPSRKGYTFDGWYAPGATEKFNFATDTVTGDLVLTAKWVPEIYTITYEYNDKDIKNKKQLQPKNPNSYTIEDAITLKPIEAAGEHGKQFVKWRCDLNKDGVAETITEIPKGTTGNLTISAHWNYPVNYTVFDKNGDKIDRLSNTEYVFEDVLRSEEGYKLTALTQDGYTFDGWYQDDADLGKTEKLIKDQTLKGAKKWELYGKLTPKEYTVTFNPNADDATVAPTNKIVTFDAAYDTLPTPTREGYTFEGWYLSKTEFTDANKVEATTIVKTPGDHMLYANWAANTYTVTFNPNADDATVAPTSKLVTFDAAYGELPTPTRENYRFVGWYLNGVRVTKDTIVKTAADHTLLAGWSRSYYALTINYVDRNGKKLEKSYKASVALGADFSVPSPKIKGYKLKDKDDAVIEGTMTAEGYTYDVVYIKKSSGGSGVQIESPNKPKQDNSLKFNMDDHFAYVNGYPDGTVKPTGDVTRAEVAAILYRVMDADCVKTYETTRCSFSDVVRGDWFNLYVATLENADVIVDTRTNGKFRPNEAITRAELAAMLAQFADIKSAANSFNDVSARHWASDEIAVCAKMGWINGYPDGSFRPDATITRAEMMAMINRALGRTPKSADDLLSGMKTWRDNANVNAWYYLDVQEATNSHTYTKSGSHETWKKLR